MSDNSTLSKDENSGKAKPALTPHEYYNHHLQNPNEPITDEDIRNLKLDSGAVSKEHQVHKINIISPEAEGVSSGDNIEENEDGDNL